MGCTLGHELGYKTGLRGKYSEKTRVLYMTDHTLLSDFIVFLTSAVEIERACQLACNKLGESAVILPLHGKLQPEDQQKVFKEMHFLSVERSELERNIALIDCGMRMRNVLALGRVPDWLTPLVSWAFKWVAGRLWSLSAIQNLLLYGKLYPQQNELEC
jgi:hypothetical protein